MRVPCTKCGTEILQETAKANGGLCGLCARGGGFCLVCGERVWEANKIGEYIHPNCALKRRDKEVATSSGIWWNRPDEIDWDVFRSGIVSAAQRCFRRIATANPKRSVKDVVLAYRIGEGIRIEPCVTFSDGEYFNASLDDDSLFEELAPLDHAISRIESKLDDFQNEEFSKLLESRIPDLMNEVFDVLRRSDFGLNLDDGCTMTLKDF